MKLFFWKTEILAWAYKQIPLTGEEMSNNWRWYILVLTNWEIRNENKGLCKYPRSFPVLAWKALIFGVLLKRTITSLTWSRPLSWSELLLFSHTLKGSSQSSSLYDLNFSQCYRIKELHLPCYSKSSKHWTKFVFPNIVYYCISVILCSKSTEIFALFYLQPTFSCLIPFTLLKLLLFPHITSS